MKFSKWIIRGCILLIVTLVLMGAKGIVIVRSEELGILMTFGRASKVPLEPGLRIIIPFVQRVEKIWLSELKKQVISEDAGKAQTRSKFSPDERSKESSRVQYFLTADENLVAIDASIQYKIKDPALYLFHADRRDEIVKNLALDALTQEIIATSVDDVLSRGRAELILKLRDRLQRLCSDLDIGVVIISFLLNDVVPPPLAAAAFQQVSNAKAEASQIQSKAQAEATKSLAESRGKASQILASISSYREEEMAKARGEAERFDKFIKEYRKDPSLTMRRLALEAQQRVLLNAKKLYYDKAKGDPKIVLRP